MWLYVIKRLAATILVVVAASALTFGILHMAPGATPVLVLKYAFIGMEEVPTDFEIADITRRFNLDAPLLLQYFWWLREALSGSLGTSYVYGQPVAELLMLKLPATALLALISSLVSLLLAVPLGMYSALKRNTLLDHAGRLITLFAVSMPGFWLGMVLIIVFSIKLDLLPVTGYGGFSHLVLPCLTLGAGMSAVTMRMMRSSVLEVMGQDFITTARSKGLSEAAVFRDHAFKNALLPVLTVAGLQFGHLLGGSVIVETVFSWPGLGKLLVDSIFARDLPMIQGCVLLVASAYALINLLVDFLYALIDPRIHYREGW